MGCVYGQRINFMRDNVDEFKKEFDALIKKYDVAAILLVVGIMQHNKRMDEAVLARGDATYIGSILGQAQLFEPIVRTIIKRAASDQKINEKFND